MSVVLVERSFTEPTNFEVRQAAEAAVAVCFDEQRVKFLSSYLSKDRRHMICLYDAADMASVRVTQDASGLSYDRIWEAHHILPPEPTVSNPAYDMIVIQREFPSPMSTADIYDILTSAMGCCEIYRVDYLESYLSADGLRMICCYRAPDSESTRLANQKAGLPFLRAWPAQQQAG